MTIDTWGADASTSVTVQGTIANGGTITSAIACGGLHLVHIAMPSSWTTAALPFTTTADLTGATAQALYDNTGTEVSVAAAASRNITIPSTVLGRGQAYLAVRSGTAGTPVAQAAERVLTLTFVKYS